MGITGEGAESRSRFGGWGGKATTKAQPQFEGRETV